MSNLLGKKQKTYEFICTQCGGNMYYRAGSQAISCQRCQHEYAVATTASQVTEKSLAHALQSLPIAPLEPPANTIDCTNCGAQFDWDNDEISGHCPYCQTPIAKLNIEKQSLAIEGIIPIDIDKDQAEKRIQKWLGRRWFAPNLLKSMTGHIKSLDSVYLPYWTFDALTHTHYHGQQGRIITETRINSQGEKVLYTRTIWRPVSGMIHHFFDDVLVFGSHLFPKLIIDKLAPWQLQKAKPYTQAYVAGHRAQHYQLDIKSALNQAKQAMHHTITRLIYRDIGGDRQRIDSQSTQYQNSTYKILLLPIWHTQFSYRGKSYHVIVNGQTGKVAGTHPISLFKVSGAILASLIVMAVLYYLYHSGYL